MMTSLHTNLFFSRKGILTLVFAALVLTSFGQFQQRITFNGSIGIISTMGDYELKYEDGGWNEPYIFPYFWAGASFSGGMQYNFNQRFSIEGKIYTFYLWEWEIDTDVDYDEYFDDVTFDYWHLSLGVAPKFYILPGKKINPYLFGEVNVSFNDMNESYEDNYWDDYEEYTWLEGDIALGYSVGAGFDLNIIENLGLFVQGGYYSVLLSGMLDENLMALRTDAGIKISLFKSKQL